ncbi:MAG: hypothetical protein R3F61_25115 [Myxococcota bacterium]
MEAVRISGTHKVVVDDEESAVETEIWWVTDTVYLRVPVDLDPELLAALVDAICRC